MCGASFKDDISILELRQRLCVNGVAVVDRCERLRRFGHLESKENHNWESTCRNVVVDGVKSKGRSKKTWEECVEQEIYLLGLRRESAKDRVEWKDLIRGNRASIENRTLKER